LEGARLGGRDMEGWRTASSRVLGHHTLGYFEFWIVVLFGLSRVWHAVGHACIVKSGQEEDRFAGIRRSFVVRASGDGLGRRQIGWKSKKQFEKPKQLLCVFGNVRLDMLSTVYARRYDSCCNGFLL
jgi:hypothetical protein